MKYLILSFDDGRNDFYSNVYPILKEKNIPSTLNVSTGFVEHTTDCSFEPLSYEKIKDILKDGLCEVALHGHRHLHLETYEDLESNFQKISKNLGVITSGLAMPYTQYPSSNVISFINDNNIKYCRIGEVSSKKKITKKFFHFMYKIFGENSFYEKEQIFNVDSLLKLKKRFEKKGFFILHSIPILKKMDFNFYCNIIKKCPDNSCICFMFHSIDSDKKNSSKFTWDFDNFKKLVDEIVTFENNKLIRIVKTCDLIYF